MEIKTNLIEYDKEFDEIFRLFFPSFKSEEKCEISHELKEGFNIVNIEGEIYKFKFEGNISDKKEMKNGAKLAIYDAMSKHFNKSFEWGDITGVRPTKLAYDLLEKGIPE